jgi:uncharacterized protein
MRPRPPPTDRPLRVLSLAGGGFLGLYTALVLEALEACALSRSVTGTKYSGQALRAALQAEMGELRPAEGVHDDAGAVGWLSDGRLVLTLLSVQQQHVQAMMEDRLGERYLRLDANWPPQAGLGIDVATPQAVLTLGALAQQTLTTVDAQRLAAFV